ncbi:MAG: DNA primase [Chloroflexota bacterium]
MSAIEEIKQKLDILDVVSQYVKLTKSGRTFRGLCPFHQEKHGSFFVYPENQSWHCFGACSTGGDVFSFVMRKEGLDFGEALRLLAERAGVSLPTRPEGEAKAKEWGRLYEMNQEAARYFHDFLLHAEAGKRARDYVATRGLNIKTIMDFELGYGPAGWEALKEHLTGKGYAEAELIQAGLVIQSEAGKTHDRFRNKLMFPITDERGHVIGFGARVLDNTEPKYVNSPETPLFSKSGSIYAINRAAASAREKGEVVVVEGYMDVLTAHQNSFTNVVAAMGTAITERQIAILRKLTRNVKLALDADSAGEEAMKRCAALENALGGEIGVIRMPEGKDPDDVIRENKELWRKLTQEMVPVVDYILNGMTAGLDLSRAGDKTRLVDEFMPVIAGMADSLRRIHYLQKLAQLVRVDEHQLEVSLAERRLAGSRPQRAGAVTSPNRKLVSSPLEEYCLSLLLKNPVLKHAPVDLLAEYFENSENREIFNVWQMAESTGFKESLTPEIWEHLDLLMAMEIPGERTQERYADCALRLKERYLRNREMEKSLALALEAETGGTSAELAKLSEQGISESEGLKKVFTDRAKRGAAKGAKDGV